MNDILREFLLETHENLSQLDLDLVTLEKEPGERETLARVFRTLHTVKGTAGFLGLTKLQGIAHAGENLLGRLRAGELPFTPETASALLGVVDAIRRILAALEAKDGNEEGSGDFTPVVRAVERLTAANAKSAVATPRVPAAAPAVATLPPPVSMAMPASPRSTEIPAAPAEARGAAVTDSSIRVDVGLLDKLMNLVGELVLARNQIVQFGTAQEDPAFLGTLQRLNLLTTELQVGVMKTRMQPVGNVSSKFPRIVRDLAVACGKQVNIAMLGQETELDKSIMEAIRDPLTHMVRNAVDHGIEMPAERTARGKPAEGRLLLNAFHEGGKVVIELTDDGGGIDPRSVRDKAIREGLISPEHADRMTERELVNLVFLPGFSTRDRVTQFSGRGVGMDVVRTNIGKVGGAVDLESQLGHGTTVRMKIPLTLAIIPALTVSAGGDRFAIPQVSLLELLRLEGDQVKKGIEYVHGAPVYRLRGNLLPLVYLDRELGIEAASTERGELSIVVLQAGDRSFGLIVDGIHDTEEIVVKPLQKQLKEIAAFSGATIMGDGKVVLILDVLGLAQRSGVIAGAGERAIEAVPATAAKASEDRQTVLLCSSGDGARMAIPLAQVARLEEFPRAAVERVGRQRVIQYRGELLPLVPVARILERGDAGGRRRRRTARPAKDRHNGQAIQVVVHAGADRQVGLVVGRILDVVDEAIAGRSPATRPGVLFNAVVQDKVTEFLDLDRIIGAALPAGTGS